MFHSSQYVNVCTSITTLTKMLLRLKLICIKRPTARQSASTTQRTSLYLCPLLLFACEHLLWTSFKCPPRSCESERGSLQIRTDRSDSRMQCRGKNANQQVTLVPCWVSHPLNALSCRNSAAVSSSHGNLCRNAKNLWP